MGEAYKKGTDVRIARIGRFFRQGRLTVELALRLLTRLVGNESEMGGKSSKKLKRVA